MARTLDVFLNKHACGHLTQDDHGAISFAYLREWIGRPGALPLSQSLPLRPEPFTRKECGGFFGGILPEQTQRDIIAGNLGISKNNDFAMLELIGGECAGAVTFMPFGAELPSDEHDYRPLDSRELAEIIRQLPRRPLMAGEEGIRLSLAGAQAKLAVHVDKDKISIPLGGAPSTHILKPAIEHFEGIVFNEALCMKLARSIGLKTAGVEVRQTEGIDYLLIERFDRKTQGSVTTRLHQEDFCQALGIVSEMKYQNEGGPSFKQSFELLRSASSAPAIDLAALLDAAIFNFLIGNHDAHGKNFSLLYVSRSTGIQTTLAPLYDLVSTIYFPDLSRKVAMKIGGEYDSSKVLARQFEQFAEEAGLSKAPVVRRVSKIAKLILERLPEVETNSVSTQVAQLIRERCENSKRGR